jgi:eukaryotic-like serine/threonine-protein kinase
MNDDHGLVDLAASVADGDVIDWAALEAELTSDSERALFRQLRVLADIADLHRSVPDADEPADQAAAPEVVTSAPSLASTDATVDVPPASLGRWGPYDLRAVLGIGTFGEVVLASDHLQRDVVIRFLPAEAAAEHAEALLRSGQVLASLRHPNVVQVYGSEYHDERVGLVMECIEGRDLSEVVSGQGTLSAREAALVGWELCRAVSALHRGGLVHGLLSPGNIVREAGGRLVLLDVWPSGVPITSLLLTRTSLPFLAPEVAGGAEPSVRSDVYSLGAVLYYLVAGLDPVTLGDGTLPGVVEAHRAGRRVSLADARPDVPDDFIRVVERATDPDPARRFSSVSSLKDALSRTLGWDTWARKRGTTDHGTDTGQRHVPGGLVPTPLPPPPPAARWSAGLIAVALTALVVGALAVWFLLPRLVPGSGGGATARLAASLPEDVRVALGALPASDETLTRNVVEQLAQDLTTSRRLRVITPAAVELFVGRPVTEIMQAVDADVFLEVDARRSGEDVEASVRIVRAGGDAAAVTVAGAGGSLRPLTLTLAERVVASLASSDEPLRPSLRTQLPLDNPEAMRAYTAGLRGLSRGGRADVEEAADAFRRATEYEPEFVLAYAKWAEALLSLYRHNALQAEEALPRVQVLVTQALTADAQSAEAYAALADLYAERHEWSQAERHFERSLALNPSGEYARIRYAMLLSGRGRVDEAVEQILQASALNPLSSLLGGYTGATLHYAHRFEEAAATYERVLRFDSQYTSAYIGLCKAYTELQRTADALRTCREVASQHAAEDPFVLSQYVKIHADAGSPAEARQHLATLQRLYQARPTGDGAFWVALAYVSLNEPDEALRWLDQAIDLRSSRLAYARVDSRLDPLRNDPRFLARMAIIEQVTSAPVVADARPPRGSTR